MPVNFESTPPPRIGKIGPYTVFITPPPTPSPTHSSRPDFGSPHKPAPATPLSSPLVRPPVQSVSPPVQSVSPPPAPAPVQAPPSQFYTSKPPGKSHSAFGFFWDAVAKVQHAHASLDEHVAYWFGLDQSRYQWALDDYYESKGMNPKDVKAKDLPKMQNV